MIIPLIFLSYYINLCWVQLSLKRSHYLFLSPSLVYSLIPIPLFLPIPLTRWSQKTTCSPSFKWQHKLSRLMWSLGSVLYLQLESFFQSNCFYVDYTFVRVISSSSSSSLVNYSWSASKSSPRKHRAMFTPLIISIVKAILRTQIMGWWVIWNLKVRWLVTSNGSF